MTDGTEHFPAGDDGRTPPGRRDRAHPPEDLSSTSNGFDWTADDFGSADDFEAPAVRPTAPRPGPAPAQRQARARPTARATAGPPVESRHGQAVVQGQARGIQQRGESYGDNGRASILNFRLELYDDAGNRLRPVPVQMRAIAFDGSLGEGDQVRVSGRWKRGTLHSKEARHLARRRR